MRKFIFLIVLMSSKSVVAQSSHINLGLDFGIPTKSFGNAALGLGGSLQHNYSFTEKIASQLHVGFSSFSNKVNSSQKVTFLPIRIGLMGFIYQDLLFLTADAGVSRYYSPNTGTRQNGFSFGAGWGYKLPVSTRQFMQFSAYYNLHKYKGATSAQKYNYNWFNIRVAYGLSWGKGLKKSSRM